MPKEIDVSLLRRLLRYEPETGRLFWLPRPREMFRSERSWKMWNTRYASMEAFLVRHNAGYYQTSMLGGVYLAHRVAWALATGSWPTEEIDHVNGCRDDNRLENLRAVSHAENAKNLRLPTKNTSGIIGVSFCAGKKPWNAKIKAGGRHLNLGHFRCKTAAMVARKAAERKFGFHENHGRPHIEQATKGEPT